MSTLGRSLGSGEVALSPATIGVPTTDRTKLVAVESLASLLRLCVLSCDFDVPEALSDFAAELVEDSGIMMRVTTGKMFKVRAPLGVPRLTIQGGIVFIYVPVPESSRNDLGLSGDRRS